MKTEEEKTNAIGACTSFSELLQALKDNEPFVSHSKNPPVSWTADKLVKRIFSVLDGYPASLVTRTNGIRDKVLSLISNLKS